MSNYTNKILKSLLVIIFLFVANVSFSQWSITGNVKYNTGEDVQTGEIRAYGLDQTGNAVLRGTGQIQNDGSYVIGLNSQDPCVPLIPADDEDHLPAFYPSALLWEDAAFVTPTMTGTDDVDITTEKIGDNAPIIPTSHTTIVNGKVSASNNADMSSAIVYAKYEGIIVGFTSADAKGNYEMELPEATYEFTVNYFGHETQNRTIDLKTKSTDGSELNFTFSTDNNILITSSNSAPEKYSLSQNFPNPFNPSTTINFEIPADAFVSLEVYDMSGRKVEQLVNGNLTSGSHSVKFDASSLTSGVYFYKIKADNFVETKKMLLVK